MTSADVIVIGGGIAGVSIAHELSATAGVGVLEAEPVLARHTTGRSAATWVATYGPGLVRRFTIASRPALEDPSRPWGRSLLRPLPSLTIATEAERDALGAQLADARTLPELAKFVELLTGPETERLNPTLRPGHVAAGMLDRSAQELDVAALHQGYVSGGRLRGVQTVTGARVVSAERRSGRWRLTDAAGARHEADTVVVAAGAWSDVVAGLFGSAGVGILPRRRSMFTCAAPTEVDVRGLPLTGSVAGTWYLRPESGGQLLCSPEDEALQAPGDPRADELEVARAIEEINEATTLGLRSVRTAWAGQRSFAPDGLPVVGRDPDIEGVFWFAGQGGYGVQLAPALAEFGAAALTGATLPEAWRATLGDPADVAARLTPDRPRTRVAEDALATGED